MMHGKILKRAAARFRQLGGFSLLREYIRYGILWKSVGITLSGFLKGKPLKEIYSEILRLITPAIWKKYREAVPEVIARYKDTVVSSAKSDIVWFCWLQGMDSAPELVRKCHANLERYLKGKRVIVIDEATLGQYVTLPDIIVERWRRHEIPAALYSDIIRLELLIKYGGTWIDSTVLCTGVNFEVHGMNHSIQEFLDAELFLFQFRKPTESVFRGISNWFITARAGHPMLLMVRDMLVKYWEENDCVLSFFIFHIFFSMIVKQEPSLIENMPYGFSPNSLFLENHLGEKFNQEKWERLVGQVCFHKLTYRLDKSITESQGNYYNMIFRRGIC